ncbi:hypothetical protein [Micromonospora zhanjiangensis]
MDRRGEIVVVEWAGAEPGEPGAEGRGEQTADQGEDRGPGDDGAAGRAAEAGAQTVSDEVGRHPRDPPGGCDVAYGFEDFGTALPTVVARVGQQ